MHRFMLFSVVFALVPILMTPHSRAQATLPDRDQYGGWPQIMSNATGFFRVDEINKTWWCVTPAGNGFFAIGTDHVNYNVHPCEALGYAPYAKNVRAAFNDNEDAWATSAVARLQSWGFNLLGANNSPSTRSKGMAYTEMLVMGYTFAGKDGLVQRTTWTGFPNVFNPEFEKECEQIAEATCAKLKDDPWLFGYFIDNELEWFGKSGNKLGIAEEAIKKPASDTAKKAFIELLKSKYDTISKFNDAWNLAIASWDDLDAAADWDRDSEQAAGDKREFVRLAAEKYFSITTAAIRKFDPNHMVLGCRFAGVAPDILDIAGKYCDIVSFNRYGQVDLENEDSLDLDKELRGWYFKTKRPIMITEWSFPALDAGLPCAHGAGQRVATQKERALAFDIYQRALFSLPFVVGSDYFMWVDEPAQGISKTFPEDSNYGLVDVNDKPYIELTQAATQTNKLAYQFHSGRTVDVGIDPLGTGMRDGTVAILVYGDGNELPVTADMKVQVDDELHSPKVNIVRGPTFTVAIETKLGPGAHYVSVDLDPDRKLPEANRANNKLRQMIYEIPDGWKKIGDYDVTYRVPIGVYSASPVLEQRTVVVPLAGLDIFRYYGRTITISALQLEDSEGRPVYFEIYDMDEFHAPSRADDLVFQAKVGAGRTETYYLWVGRSSDFAEPMGKFVSPMIRSEFTLDNGTLKLTKTSRNGVAIDSVALGDTELGSFEMLICQSNGDLAWPRPNKLREISLLQGDLLTRLIIGCDYVPNEEERAQGRRSFVAYYVFELPPKKPWFAAQFRSLWNTDSEPWTLKSYFYYPQSALGGDAKDDEAANLGLPASGGWRDPTSGAVYGLLALPDEKSDLHISFWKDDKGQEHSDAYVDVGQYLAPGRSYEVAGPKVYLFGAITRGESKPWNDIRSELLRQPIYQAFQSEVEAKEKT